MWEGSGEGQPLATPAVSFCILIHKQADESKDKNL